MKKAEPRDEFIRKRMERQKKIRKRRLIFTFIFLICLSVCVGIILSLTVFFPIEKIMVSGSKVYEPQQIIKKSGIEIGDNLFTVSKASVEDRLKAKLPYVETVDFDRELPGTLKIKVKDASEYACYFIDDEYYTVSRENWVLEKNDSPPENIFVVTGSKALCNVGSQVKFSDEETKVLMEELIASLSTEKIDINSVDLSNKVEITLKVDSRFTVNLGTSNNITEKIKHLRAMISKISPEKQGKINLSMWSETNTKGTFIEEITEK